MHAGAFLWLLLWGLLTAGSLLAMYLIHRGDHAQRELGGQRRPPSGPPLVRGAAGGTREDSCGDEDERVSATLGR